MPRHLLTIDDLSVDEIGLLTTRNTPPAGPMASPPTVGLVFQTSSLRTRLGFAIAARRLGGLGVDVGEPRWQRGMSTPESLADTLRTVSGMVDLVVARVDQDLAREALDDLVTPLINGGDAREHPTQALVDLAAIEAERGPIDELVVGLCGDLSSRSSTSLLALLERRPPRRLVLMAPAGREGRSTELAPLLETRTERRSGLDASGIDVLSMTGLAPGQGDAHLDDGARRPFMLTRASIESLPPDAVVLSPMPIIDEIADDARADPRCRFHQQSDRSVAVRVAILEHLLAPPGPPA